MNANSHYCCPLAVSTYLDKPNMLRWKKRDSFTLPDKWTPIAPSAPSGSKAGGTGTLAPSKPGGMPMVGKWPENVLLHIVSYLPIPDLPAVSRVNRAFSRIVRDERGWEDRCKFLRLKDPESEFFSIAEVFGQADLA